MLVCFMYKVDLQYYTKTPPKGEVFYIILKSLLKKGIIF
jgi:hypothetical protein